MIVYISIGNSDDKLSQNEWAQFHGMVQAVIRQHATAIHGSWVSPSTDPWQNACWCIEPLSDQEAERLKGKLRLEAKAWRQDSIAWAEAPETEFIGPEVKV